MKFFLSITLTASMAIIFRWILAEGDQQMGICVILGIFYETLWSIQRAVEKKP